MTCELYASGTFFKCKVMKTLQEVKRTGPTAKALKSTPVLRIVDVVLMGIVRTGCCFV